MFHRSSGRVGRSFQSHKRSNGQRLKKDQLPQLARNRAEPCPAQSNKECQHQAKSNFNALKARRHKKLSPPRTYQFTTQSPLPLFGEPLARRGFVSFPFKAVTAKVGKRAGERCLHEKRLLRCILLKPKA